jgi:hypothetical protein
MLNNRRMSMILVAVIAFVFVFLMAGLPFGRFSPTAVNAQYAGPNASNEGLCGGTPEFQVRLVGGTVYAYTSSEFAIVAAVIPDAYRQKYLLCTGNIDTRPDGYVAVLFPGNAILYIRAEDVGDIVPRNYQDSQ